MTLALAAAKHGTMKTQADFTIRAVETPDDIDAVKRLIMGYVDWLGLDLSYQNYDEELAAIPGGVYDAPAGALLIAVDAHGDHLGCIGLKAFGKDGACEMKRLFVAPEGRGRGVGQALIAAIVGAAERIGYREMLLDTLPTMEGAIRLYEAAGFRQVPAYYETPIEETLFFAKNLVESA